MVGHDVRHGVADPAERRLRGAAEQHRVRRHAARRGGRQNPRAGALADEGSTVTINVSAGPGQVVGPDASAGQAQQEAEAALREAGLDVEVEEVFSDDGRQGPGRRHRRRRPARSSSAGRTVTLRVSKGAEQVEVPDVTGETEDERAQRDRGRGPARRQGHRGGVRGGARARCSRRARPPASASRKNSAVDLTVAKGVEIPDVVDETEDDATTALEDAGFEVRVRDSARSRPTTTTGSCSSSARRPARSARKGSRVTIIVGQLGSRPRRRRRRPRPRRPPREGRRPGRRPLVRARGLAQLRRRSSRERSRRPATRSLPVTIERSGAWTHDGETLALTPGERAARRRRGVPGRCTARSARTARCRACSSCSTCPYVGAGVLASSLCMDKVVFKEVLAAADVPQVASLAVREHRWRDERAAVRAELAVLGTPVFVKPARLGSSVGIAKAWGEADLATAVDGAFAHDSLVIVEAFSDGIEVECSVLGERPPRGVGARRDRRAQGRLVRLRGQVQRRRDGARRARAAARRGDRARSARWRSTRSCASAAPASRASTSSSRATACWSTSSTRCRASPARARTRSCGRPPASRPRAVRPPARLGARALPAGTRGHRSGRPNSARRGQPPRMGRPMRLALRQRDLADLDALAVRRQLGDPDQVVAVALAAGVELEALVVAS